MKLLCGVKVRCWLSLVTGLVECLCFAGIVYGWASLVFALKGSGYFSDQCVNATTPNGTQHTDCSKQDELFSLAFTIATSLGNVFTFPAGFFFDRFGTMAARLLAIILYTTGSLFFAFSHPGISIIIFPGLLFMGLGGIVFLLTNMQVGNLFGDNRSTVITLFPGAFGSAAISFLIMKVVFERGISLQHSFYFLSACSIIHLIRTFFLMPKMHIPYPLPEDYTYGIDSGQTKCNMPCLPKKTEVDNTELEQSEEGMEMKTSEQGSPQQPPETVSFKQCVLSWFFLWHLVWASILALLVILFIGSLNSMLTHLAQGDQALVSHYTNVFAYTQLCGVLCAPLNGLIIDRFKGMQYAPGETEEESNMRSVALSLFLNALLCLLFTICAAIPVLPLQYLTFVLQVLTLSFLFGGNAAFISIILPVCHFGKLFGLVNAVVAVVLLLQFPIVILLNEVLDGNPLYINIALCILSLATFIHPAYLYIRWRKLANRRRCSILSPTSEENTFSADNGAPETTEKDAHNT